MQELDCQAVILAGGRGNRMTDLTNSIPKSLLSVGNYPLIFYAVNYLQKAGFQSALVVLPARCVHDVQRVLAEIYQVGLKLEYVPISENDEDCGTADSIRFLLKSGKIQKHDILLLSCDLITDIALEKVLNFHKSRDAAFTCVLAKSIVDGPHVGRKQSKHLKEKDLIGVDPGTQELVFLENFGDLEGSVAMSRYLLILHPRIVMSSSLTDCHLYIVSRRTLECLLEDESLKSFKSEVVPFLLKRHLRSQAQQSSSDKSYTTPKMGGCYALVKDPASDYKLCARVNTLGSYFEVNKQVIKNYSTLGLAEPSNPPESTSVDSTSHISNDSLIGKNSVVAEKCQVKRSVIGQHCSLGKGAKIVNSLLMDHVSVASGAEIGPEAELKDCIVMCNFNVAAKAKISADVIGDESGNLLMDV